MSNNVKIVSRWGLISTPTSVEDADLLTQSSEWVSYADGILSEAADAVAKLVDDPALTRLGVQQRRAEIGRRTAEKIRAAVAARTDRLARQLNDAEKALLDPRLRRRIPDGWTPEDARAAEAEARVEFRKMTPELRESAYRAALRGDDRLTIRALELAPPTFALISPELEAKADEIYAQSVEPEKYAAMEEKRATLSHIDFAGDLAVQQLSRNIAGQPAEEPLDIVRETLGGDSDE